MKTKTKPMNKVFLSLAIIFAIFSAIFGVVSVVDTVARIHRAKNSMQHVPLFVSQCANGGSGDPLDSKTYCACVDGIAREESNVYSIELTQSRGYEIVDMCLRVTELRKAMGKNL